MSSTKIFILKYSFLLFILTVSISIYAQQIPIYSMQEMVRPGINPAYAGLEGTSDVVLLTRQQWVGFDGAPKSYFFAANVPLRNPKTGIGFDFQRQLSGPLTKNGIFLSYSYTINVSALSTLSFGLRGGFSGYKIILSDLLRIDPGDPLLESSVTNRILPNFGTGFHYTFRKYYLDFSIPLLLRNEFRPDGEERVGLQNREERVYNFQTGAAYELAEGLTILPALGFWLSKGASPLVEVRLSTTFQSVITVGATYRINGSAGAYVSYRVFENFLLAYAYELPLSYDYHLTSGTHEVVIGFDFQFLSKKTQSPRRF